MRCKTACKYDKSESSVNWILSKPDIFKGTIHTYIHTYIYIYVCQCVCESVCVCECECVCV